MKNVGLRPWVLDEKRPIKARLFRVERVIQKGSLQAWYLRRMQVNIPRSR